MIRSFILIYQICQLPTENKPLVKSSCQADVTSMAMASISMPKDQLCSLGQKHPKTSSFQAAQILLDFQGLEEPFSNSKRNFSIPLPESLLLETREKFSIEDFCSSNMNSMDF